MTIPKELLDQLLTGYLDDALSADERARVEQLLRTDAEVAEELAQMHELQRSLKAVAEADSWIKLDDGFAGRVLEAAVARGRAEGIGDDHPLVRLSEQPIGTSTTQRPSSWRIATGLIIGLAASIAIAVAALRPGVPEHSQGVVVATTADGNVVQPAGVLTNDVPEMAIESANPAGPEMIAEAAAGSATDVNPDVESLPDSAQPPTRDAIAKSELLRNDSPLQENIANAMTSHGPANASLTAILVWEVRLTDIGRASGAVRSAMRQANIDSAGEKKISSAIVALAAETANPASDEKISIHYLQAPAKSLDRLYLNLVADHEGIASVRMTIAMDAPILNVINAVRPDPTSIQHSSAALELSGDTGSIAQFAAQLGKLSYVPANPPAAVTSSNGPDVMAQVLMVVR